MTRQDFVATVNQKNRFKIGTEIAMTIMLGLTAVVLIYYVSPAGSPTDQKGGSAMVTSFIYLIGVVMFALSIWGLLKVWREYQIEILVTNLNIKKNFLLIDKVASGFRWATIQKGEIREYITKGDRWPSSSYEIRILADDGKVYIDLQSIQTRLLDFGDRSRLIASIKEGFAVSLIEDAAGHHSPQHLRNIGN
jgi:hypothetical protein